MAAQAPRKILLSVRSDERILVPWRVARFARRTWFSVTLAAILSMHAILLAILLWHDAGEPPPPAKAEETPVEVVMQAPEPRQPPAPRPPALQPPPEKPATSAPRAQNEETLDHDAKDSHAPKAMTTPEQATPPPQQATAGLDQPKPDPAPDADASKPPDAPKPPDDPKEAEALDQAPPEPPRRPAKLARAAKPAPSKPPPGRTAKTALQQLAGTSDLPDYTFAKPMRKRAKVTGGTEDDRYLAVVYAMVTQNHEAIPLPDGDWTVAVSFQVDGHGDLLGINLKQSSGYREIDAAAVAAVERAAPFPPPPSGGVTGLVARLSSARARAALAGDR